MQQRRCRCDRVGAEGHLDARKLDQIRILKLISLWTNGIAIDDHIVVYAKRGMDAGFLLGLLDYAGAENISILDGGIIGWELAELELSDEEPDWEEKTFEIASRKNLLVDTDYVKENLDNPAVKIVDVRVMQQSTGLTGHGLADRPGSIPG